MAAAKDLEFSANDTSIICKRCNINLATQSARQDPVCDNCFIHYVTTKAIKRLELQKSRSTSPKTARKLLVPISFGPSSTSLLYLVDKQLRGQLERMGRTFHELHIVHVDLYSWEEDKSEEIHERVNRIETLFPKHTYSIIGIEESLNISSIEWESLGLPNQTLSDQTTQTPLKSRFRNLLDSLPSPTSRSDVLSTLLNRLLLSHATTQNCTSILFGDSTTRLAERTLTATATGRGFSLPWLVSEGPSPVPPQPSSHPNSDSSPSNPITPQPIQITYPLRDVLRKELLTFTRLHSSLTSLTTYDPSYKNISASDKATTINELMIQYFESVEVNFPSIVANVVRTGSKLVAPAVDASTQQDRGHGTRNEVENRSKAENGTKNCNLCALPVAEGTDGIFGWGGDQNDDDISIRKASREMNGEGKTKGILCYGCSRSIHG